MKHPLSKGIDVEPMPDGSLRVTVSCASGQEELVSERIVELAHACLDDTYGVFDRLRDLECQELDSVLERETVEHIEKQQVRWNAKNPK